jgi:predicted anti-sigma-YlaC factor YlaD
MKNWFKRLFTRPSRNKQTTDRTTTHGLACKEVVELVTDYLEGVLLPEKRAPLEEHLAGCPGCRNYIEQVRLTIGMLRNLAQEPIFPETKEDLLQVFRQWKKSS